MTRSASRLRTARVSAALLLSAAAVIGAVGTAAAAPVASAPVAAGHAGAQPITGTSGPEAVLRSRQVTRRALRAPTGSSTSFSFASLLDGKPVRWDPCTPIPWTSNTATAPVGGLTVLKAAVAQVAAQTGTTWTYVGETTTVPQQGYLPTSARTAYAPVLLGWTTGASSDLLAGQASSVLAMTRHAWFGIQRADGSQVAAIRAAVVAFDATDRLPLTGPVSWSAVALHELGHVVGLGHTSDSTQLLAPVLPRTVASLQAGDKTGLYRLGRSAGCVTVQ